MELFELFAKLSLDTKDFDSKVDEAIGKAEDIGDAFDEASRTASGMSSDVKTLDEDIAALDAEIAALDEEIAALEADIEKEKEKSSKVVKGFVTLTEELIKEGVKLLLEFAKESVKAAAETGSEMAEAFNASQASLSVAMDVLKIKAGETLLPLLTKWNEFLDSVTGVTPLEKADYLLSQMEKYTFENIKEVTESLGNVFGMFEQYSPAAEEASASVEEMTAGLESQTQYWNDYAAVLQSLKAKGINGQMLADIADGTTQSYQALQQLEDADVTQLQALSEAYAAMEEAKEGAAAGIAEAKLAVDENFQGMIDSVAAFIAEMDQRAAAQSGAAATGQGVVDGLASQYPAIASWVSRINSKLSEIGRVNPGGSQYFNFKTMTFEPLSLGISGISGSASSSALAFASGSIGRAVGIDYVPYDNFAARLHEGEAVLTKAEANDWRKGTGQGVDISALTDAISSAVRQGLSNLSITMSGERVGDLVTDQVSRNIANAAWAGRYG